MQLSRGSAHVLVPATVAFLAVVATAIRVSAPPPPPPVLQPGDTAVIHGPRRYDAPIGSSNTIQTFVDSIPVVLQAYHRYVIRVKNGNPDSTQRVLRATVGIDSITGTTAQKAREIAVQPTTLITVKIRGQASAGHLTIELLEIYGGNYTVFHEVFTRTNTTSDVVFTRTFTHGGVDGPPFFLWITNGNNNGTSRLSNVTVRLNSDTVVGAPPRPNLTTGTYVMMVQVSLPSGSNTLVVTLPKKQAGFIDLLISSTDVSAPTLKVLAPIPNLYTRLDSVAVLGTMTDPSPSRVSVNGVVRTVVADTFRFNYALPQVDGNHLITFTAVDAAGNRVDSTRTVHVDRTPPTLSVTTPQNGFITNHTTIGVNATIADASPTVSLYMNGVFLLSCVPSQCSLFTVFPPIPEGPNTLVFMAKDSAGNASTTQVVMGRRDTQRPTLTVTAPADSSTVSTPTVTATGTASDAMLKDVKVNGVAVTLNNGAFSKSVDLVVGVNTIVVIATDSATNADTVRRTVTRSTLPPDPATVATPIPNNVPTNIGNSTAFLYTGANPIQTGVAAGTIEPVRAAVLRGKVLTRDQQPLPGATIKVLGHPEFGQTLSRADGMFDMAVNGGGKLTVDYQKTGYLAGQRTLDVAWQDFTIVNDVILVALDPQVTTINFSQPIQVARGTPVVDEDGTRQTTLFFQQNTVAKMIMPDSSLTTLSSVHVRATEYTVGRTGPQAMPAALPPTSGYTWAAELSADEVTSAGALGVQFDKPVIAYLENFLGFPVGLPVPLAIYNRQRGVWEPIPNGRIVKILSASGGVATIGVDTTGQPASDSMLNAMGVTTAERQQLASTYAVGQELWRMPTTHFSPMDGNFPVDPDSAAQNPDQQAKHDNDDPDGCPEQHSIVECGNQVLGERIPLTGTSEGLNYRSIRALGHRASSIVTIPLRDSIPPNIRAIELQLDIAGRRFSYTFGNAYDSLPFSDTTTKVTFEWDGKDAYGRTINGAQPIRIALGYVYQVLYMIPPDQARSFGLTCFGPRPDQPEVPNWEACRIPNLGRRSRFSIKGQLQQVLLGELKHQDLGGWTFDGQHGYDPIARTLYLGTGERRRASSVNGVIKTVAGNGQQNGPMGDGGLATNASLAPEGIALTPDGTLLITDAQYRRVRRVGSDGHISTIAGNGSPDFSGDGVQATQTGMDPVDVKVAADGSIYIADSKNHRIRRVGTNGIISTVAGTGVGNCDGLGAGDGGPATQAPLCFPYSIALGSDGSLYIADTYRVRRVDAIGTITTVAGIDRSCDFFAHPEDAPACGDELMAVRAPLNFVESIEIGPDGSVYIVDDVADVIRRVTPNGVIHRVAGMYFQSGFDGDGRAATQTRLRQLNALMMAPDGGYYITDAGRIRRITSDAIIYTVAGGAENNDFAGDGGAALQAHMNHPSWLALGKDGSIYESELFSSHVRRIAPPLPGFTNFEYGLASEDGQLLYRFDAYGTHLRTIHSFTGAVLNSFLYDTAGSLIAVVNEAGDTTKVERTTNGAPTAIVAPFGQRTTLSLTPEGSLGSVTNPASEAFTPSYQSGGLLKGLTDPRSHASAFVYDSVGRLKSDSDAVGGIVRLNVLRDDSVTEATFHSALDRIRVSRLERRRTGEVRRLATDGAGFTTVSSADSGGRSSMAFPTGDSLVTVRHPDPRWGMQAPILDSAMYRTPSGVRAVIQTRRNATLSDMENPLSLVEQTDSVAFNGNWSVRTYTAAGRQVVTTTPEGRQLFATLDSLGRVINERVPSLDSVVYRYNARGRIDRIQLGGRVANFTYDSFGLQYGYDATGNLTSLTPPGQSAHLFRYNAIGLDSVYEPPSLGAGTWSTQYRYNLDRQITEMQRPDGIVVSVGYEPTSGRLSNITFDRGTLSIGYSPNTGHATSLTAPGGVGLGFTYDGSLPLSATWSGPVAGTVGVTYGNDFRVATQTVNGANAVSFGYDRDGLLTAAGNLGLKRHAQRGLVERDSVGSSFGVWSYDSKGALSSYAADFSGTPLFATSYNRDSLSRITQLSETIQGVTTLRAFTYDSAGRLATVRRAGQLVATYRYDANSNRLDVTTPNGTVAGTYDAQDRLLTYGTANYTYTRNGELLTKTDAGGTTTYTYDALGNLVHVALPSATTIDYVIDPQNRRIGKKINGALVQGFLWQNQLAPVAELDGSGAVVSRFVYGTRINVPDYIVKNGQTYRLVLDHLGSVRLVVNVSDGSIAQRIDYDEFGTVISNTNPGFQPFGFAGGLVDTQTGLVRFGIRDYEPRTGRWTAKDPLLFADGQTNLYSYVAGDPLNFLDPTGRSFWSAVRSFAVGVVTGVVGAVVVGATLSVLAAASPVLAVAGLVVLAGYTGWELGMEGQRILGGYDPWTGCSLTGEERIDEAAGLLGNLAGSMVPSGPKGPLFGRGRYRNGRPGLFNGGDPRVGWSWDDNAGRNMWGAHGGSTRSGTDWHYTPIPGPTGTGW